MKDYQEFDIEGYGKYQVQISPLEIRAISQRTHENYLLTRAEDAKRVTFSTGNISDEIGRAICPQLKGAKLLKSFDEPVYDEDPHGRLHHRWDVNYQEWDLSGVFTELEKSKNKDQNMEVTKEKNDFSALLKQHEEMKKKHPDAIILFRVGDFYETLSKDAIVASEILGITLTKRANGKAASVELAGFPHHALDTYLPKLVRAGKRVAICESILDPKLTAKEEIKTEKTSTNKTTEEKAQNQKTQKDDIKNIPLVDFLSVLGHDKPISTKGQTAVYTAPYNSQSTITVNVAKNTWKDDSNKNLKGGIYDLASQLIGTQNMGELNFYIKGEMNRFKKNEDEAQKKSEAQSHKPSLRPPQMVTVNGDKVSHGHAYQGTINEQNWYFTARLNGVQLKPQLMSQSDVVAYSNKEITVPELMQKYYPTKLMQRVPDVAFTTKNVIAGPEDNMTVEKFNVYKEKNPGKADFGMWKFYAQVDDKKLSAVADKKDLNAYFDRVVTPGALVEKYFGERLHLKQAFEKYTVPEGVKNVYISKSKEGPWTVQADLGEYGRTSRVALSFDDGYSYFKTKTATKEQLAGKYLSNEISETLSTAKTMKLDSSLKR